MIINAKRPKLYQAVRCPRCREVKVTRYSAFRHCRKSWTTAENLADAPDRHQGGAKASGKVNTLEVSW